MFISRSSESYGLIIFYLEAFENVSCENFLMLFAAIFIKSHYKIYKSAVVVNTSRVIPRVVTLHLASKKSDRLTVSFVEISTAVYVKGEMEAVVFPNEISVSPTSGRRSASPGDSRYPKLLITLHPRCARYRAWVSHYHVNIVV